MLGQQGEGQYAHHQRRRGKMMILLLACLAFGCLLCSLVGPASAVLMIPQYNWFHESDIDREAMLTPRAHDTFTESYTKEYPTVHYPNIFIAPDLDKNRIGNRGISFLIRSYNWRGAMINRKPEQKSTYLYEDFTISAQTRINVTTSLNRSLAVDATWEGETTLTSVMPDGIVKTNLRLGDYDTAHKKRYPEINYSAELTGIEVKTVCRRQKKLNCEHLGEGVANSTQWCYLTASGDPTKRQLQSSKDLLLVASPTSNDARLWIVEGPSTANHTELSDSIVVILELIAGVQQEPSLIVCSISAAFKSVTTSSSTDPFSPEKLEFHEYITYFHGESATQGPTRKLLYHKSWLEHVHGLHAPTYVNSPCDYMYNRTYSCRGRAEESPNKDLEKWGNEVIYASGYGDDYQSLWWYPSTKPVEASMAETIIGGIFMYAFFCLKTSQSQYPQGPAKVPPAYPPSLMVGPLEDYKLYTSSPVKIEWLLYGFKLGIVVLIAHSIIVLTGSLWQYRRIILIQAWGSMPEYVMLCLGSDPAHACSHVDNTCAGISQDETFNKIVRIREVTKEYLELVVVSPETILLGSVVDREKRYGSFGEGSRRMKEKLE